MGVLRGSLLERAGSPTVFKVVVAIDEAGHDRLARNVYDLTQAGQ